MSGEMSVCDISEELKTVIKRFRKNQHNSALIMKVDRTKHEIIVDQEIEELEDLSDLISELPDHQPRYVLLSYKLVHSDERLSYPLCFIFISPRDGNPELQMMYAGSKLRLQNEIDCGKVFELRELEEFTEQWLLDKLLK